jgi:transcriptional regulator with XRE-family HTH domain
MWEFIDNVLVSYHDGGLMPNRDSQQPGYRTVEPILDAIADWIKRYRYAIGLSEELAQCGSDDLRSMARDIGVSPSQLQELASEGPGASDLLQKMLLALHFDPKAFAEIDPLIGYDLQRLCITCSHKKRCKHELAAGTAAKNFREFCPNAITLDALFKLDGQPSKKSD